MREIKFRAKRKSGEWIVGSLFVEDGMGITYILSGVDTHYETNYLQVEVVSKTVGQFTGLLDSNGKEIYEGDILRFAPPWRWEEDERRMGVVVYKCYGFRIEYSDTSEALFNLAANEAPFTVIGNVYDSPELLEGKNA